MQIPGVISGHIAEFVREVVRRGRLDSTGLETFLCDPGKGGAERVASRRAPASIGACGQGGSRLIKRYFMVLGVILAVIIGGLYTTKPRAGEIKRSVDEAMVAYKEAQAAAPPGTMRDISLPRIVEEQDWILARSYSAEQDGKRFSCWGVSVVTVCKSPD